MKNWRDELFYSSNIPEGTNGRMSEPKWRDALVASPDPNREIWVWDNEKRNKFFVRRAPENEDWMNPSLNDRFCLWAYVWEIDV